MAITKLKSNLQFKLWLHPIKNKKLETWKMALYIHFTNLQRASGRITAVYNYR